MVKGELKYAFRKPFILRRFLNLCEIKIRGFAFHVSRKKKTFFFYKLTKLGRFQDFKSKVKPCDIFAFLRQCLFPLRAAKKISILLKANYLSIILFFPFHSDYAFFDLWEWRMEQRRLHCSRFSTILSNFISQFDGPALLLKLFEKTHNLHLGNNDYLKFERGRQSIINGLLLAVIQVSSFNFYLQNSCHYSAQKGLVRK